MNVTTSVEAQPIVEISESAVVSNSLELQPEPSLGIPSSGVFVTKQKIVPVAQEIIFSEQPSTVADLVTPVSPQNSLSDV